MYKTQECFGVGKKKPGLLVLDTGNGFGSLSSCKIRRFTSVRYLIGGDFSYVDDPVYGATVRILSEGSYTMNYRDKLSSNTALHGISVNATAAEIIVNPDSVSGAHLMVAVQTPNNQVINASCTTYLFPGDVVRPHGDATQDSSSSWSSSFSICKVG